MYNWCLYSIFITLILLSNCDAQLFYFQDQALKETITSHFCSFSFPTYFYFNFLSFSHFIEYVFIYGNNFKEHTFFWDSSKLESGRENEKSKRKKKDCNMNIYTHLSLFFWNVYQVQHLLSPKIKIWVKRVSGNNLLGTIMFRKSFVFH